MRCVIIEYTGCHSGLLGTLLISFFDGMRMKSNEKCLSRKKHRKLKEKKRRTLGVLITSSFPLLTQNPKTQKKHNCAVAT
jgi:hypothetical protein